MASEYKPITVENYEWRLQELEKAVAALVNAGLASLGKSYAGSTLEDLLQREKALTAFRDHAARLHYPILIGEVVPEDT